MVIMWACKARGILLAFGQDFKVVKTHYGTIYIQYERGWQDGASQEKNS